MTDRKRTLLTQTHQPNTEDFDELIRPVYLRAKKHTNSGSFSCLYLNPGFTVVSSMPSRAFFDQSIRRRTEWCVRSKRTLGRNWVVAKRVELVQLEKAKSSTAYWATAVGYSGLMLIAGVQLHPDQWANFSVFKNNASIILGNAHSQEDNRLQCEQSLE